jgi:dolichol kinase
VTDATDDLDDDGTAGNGTDPTSDGAGSTSDGRDPVEADDSAGDTLDSDPDTLDSDPDTRDSGESALGVERGELQRRLVHASGAAVPLAWAVGLLPWSAVVGLLVVGAFVAGVLEFLRLSVGLDWTIYDRLTREYEQSNPAGYALYTVSMAAVALAFRPHVAAPGMLMLALGDPVSGLLGSSDVEQVKRAPTLAAMFLVCFGLAVPFLTADAVGIGLPSGVAAAVAGAAGATLADGVKPVIAGYVVDDNLSIPPVACLAIEGTLWLVA